MRIFFGPAATLIRSAILFLLLQANSWATSAPMPELPAPSIHIVDQDGTLVLDITYRVPVSQRVAWAVLTDFESMPKFIPNLESSEILQRTDKTLQVEQKGSISLGIFPVHYESRRQIELTPYQTIRSQTLSGNTRLDSVMLLAPSADGTLLSYHATAVPDLPVPNSLISSYMSEMLEGQFKAMGQEMLKRRQFDTINPQLAQQSATRTARKPVAGKQSIPQARLTPKKAPLQTKKRPG